MTGLLQGSKDDVKLFGEKNGFHLLTQVFSKVDAGMYGV